ncbi:MAG: hypothetical protein F6J87_10425 [Spirulina sp. SIO3F2]|nr:hypothetical protein [Spirulina sp. SIO3F2]
MMTKNWSTAILGAVAATSTVVVGLASEVQAQTLVRQWSVENAVSDSYHNANHNHAFWLKGFMGGNNFDIDGPSTFKLFDNGTANLSGSIVSQNQPQYQFTFDIDFVADSWNPKRELKNSAYSIIDTDTWDFFSFDGPVSLAGAGALAGYSLDLTQRGAPNYGFQVGEGANGKNINEGISGWFRWELKDSQQQVVASNVGDINADIEAVPEPVSTVLISGLVLGGGTALKRKFARK